MINKDSGYTYVEVYDYDFKFLQLFLSFRDGLDDQGVGVRFPVRERNLSLVDNVKNGPRAYVTSCKIGTRGSFPGGKEAGA
jgi:hypothetical protein